MYVAGGSCSRFPRGTIPPKSSITYWPRYYEDRVPENIDNLQPFVTQRPSLLNDLGEFDHELHLEKNDFIPYIQIWVKGETVTYTSMKGRTVEFRRGGMAAKTRGGPLAYRYRRLWNYHKAHYYPGRFRIKKIKFIGRRYRKKRRWWIDYTYRDEVMRPEGPATPVAPGEGGRYWRAGQLPPEKKPNSAYEPGGWLTWGEEDNSKNLPPIIRRLSIDNNDE